MPDAATEGKVCRVASCSITIVDPAAKHGVKDHLETAPVLKFVPSYSR